jgi:hypothetical protein
VDSGEQVIAPTSGVDMHETSSDDAVLLPGGRRIIIRPIRPGDQTELRRLYDALDTDERHRRFFSSYHPGPGFFADLTTVGEQGGARFVAVLHEPPSDDRLLGEAGYIPLTNGDGELAVTIAHGWRDWLGSYLLDAVAQAAAASGVPNLEADVLSADGRMLDLLRARGSVVMAHEGWSVVRLLIGTGAPSPTWPAAHDGLRVLVEGGGGRWHAEHEARSAGLHVLACPGPHDGALGCPALAGERCSLAAEADVIVVSHPADDGNWPDLLRAHADLHPGVPICIEHRDGKATEDTGATPPCPIVARSGVLSFVTRLATPPDDSAAVAPGTGP